MHFKGNSLLPDNQQPQVVQAAPDEPQRLLGHSDDVPVTRAAQVNKAVDC